MSSLLFGCSGRTNGAAFSRPLWKSSKPSGISGPTETTLFIEGESGSESMICWVITSSPRADDHLDIGGIRTIDDIFLCQQVGSRDHHCSQFMQRDNREPEFITAFQYQHDHITVADPQRLEISGSLVGILFQVGKGEVYVFPLGRLSSTAQSYRVLLPPMHLLRHIRS